MKAIATNIPYFTAQNNMNVGLKAELEYVGGGNNCKSSVSHFTEITPNHAEKELERKMHPQEEYITRGEENIDMLQFVDGSLLPNENEIKKKDILQEKQIIVTYCKDPDDDTHHALSNCDTTTDRVGRSEEVASSRLPSELKLPNDDYSNDVVPEQICPEPSQSKLISNYQPNKKEVPKNICDAALTLNESRTEIAKVLVEDKQTTLDSRDMKVSEIESIYIPPPPPPPPPGYLMPLKDELPESESIKSNILSAKGFVSREKVKIPCIISRHCIFKQFLVF